MNEVKHFLLQIDEEKYPGANFRWDWEIFLALGKDGMYYGKAKCHMIHTNADSYPWMETNTYSYSEAVEYMKKYCKTRTSS